MNILNDTINILLCSRINAHLTPKERCIKISNCCAAVRKRTQDSKLKAACESIMRGVQEKKYKTVLKAIALTEDNYWLGRGK